MEESGYRFGVGVLVVASAIIGILLVVFFGAIPNFWVDRYSVTINFPAAPGVAIDTPVRKNGVKVGRVAGVTLRPGDEGVDLALEMEGQHEIRQGEAVRIGTGSLITGDAIVEFVPATEESLLARFDGMSGMPKDGQLQPTEREIGTTLMKDGDYISGGFVKSDPLATIGDLQGNFTTTLSAIERASNKIESLAGSMEDVVGNGRGELRDVIDKTKVTIDNFNRTLDSIEGVFNRIEQSGLPDALANSVEKLPGVFDEADRVLKQTKATLRSFEEAGVTASATLKNVQEFTDPFSGKGEAFSEEVFSTVQNLDALLVDLRRFTTRLNNGQGTVARLIEDEQLYFGLVRTLENIEMMSQQLRPTLDNVRVFSDKIARDPGGQIGVRGALTRRPVGSGIK
jgi:phospholipid/cholesterol/gamma-HCH transport system substrate-binding protein